MAFTYDRSAIANKLKAFGSPLRVEDFEVPGVDPTYLAAASIVESSGGTAGYATKGTYNPYGWGIYKGYKYPTWKAASQAVSKGLNSGLYRGSGLDTPAEIAAKYAPASDGNDPKGYASKIAALRKLFGSPNPAGSIFDGSGAGPTGSSGSALSGTANQNSKPVESGPNIQDLALMALNQDNDEGFTHNMGQAYLQSKLFGGTETSAPETPSGTTPAPPEVGAPAVGGGTVGNPVGSPIAGQKAQRASHQTSGLEGYPAFDYMAPAGTAVGAPVSGKVIRLSGKDPRLGGSPGGPLGYSVYLHGDDGKLYYMTHIDKLSVKAGQKVKQGQQIAVVANGPSSWSSPHVHMGVHG